MARSHGRETRIWINVYVVCRETEKEANDLRHYVPRENGDWGGGNLKIFGLHNQTLDAKTLDGHKAHFIAGHGGYPWSAPPSRSSTNSASSPRSASTAA